MIALGGTLQEKGLRDDAELLDFGQARRFRPHSLHGDLREGPEITEKENCGNRARSEQVGKHYLSFFASSF